MVSGYYAPAFLRTLADDELLALARQGSREAFEVFWLRQAPRLHHAARRLSYSDDLADDLFSHLAVKAADHRVHFPCRAAFKSWCQQVLLRAWLSTLPRLRREVSLDAEGEDEPETGGYPEPADPSPGPCELALRADLCRRAQAALERLKRANPESGEVVERHVLGDESLEAIAAATGRKREAVRARYYRGLKWLAEHLRLEEAGVHALAMPGSAR